MKNINELNKLFSDKSVKKAIITGKVELDYLMSTAKSNAIIGSIGSGKSSLNLIKLFTTEIAVQPIHPVHKCKYVRYVVAKKHLNELNRTALKTYIDWFRPRDIRADGLGRLPIYGASTPTMKKEGTSSHFKMKCPLTGVDVFGEIFFMSFETAEIAERKTNSLEYTSVWLNEVDEMDIACVNSALSRVNRYPSNDHYVGLDGELAANYKPNGRLLMDANASDQLNWTSLGFCGRDMPATMSEIDKSKVLMGKGFRLFKQQPAVLICEANDPDVFFYKGRSYKMNPDRAGKLFQDEDYYKTQQNFDSITYERKVCMKYALSNLDNIVYTNVDPNIHLSLTDYEYDPSLPLVCGVDYGLNPALLFGQIDDLGVLHIVDEFAPQNIHTSTKALKKKAIEILQQYAPHHLETNRIKWWEDPAGGFSKSNGRTDSSVFKKYGVEDNHKFINREAPFRDRKNNLLERLEVSMKIFDITTEEGNPLIQIHPRCRTFYEGLTSGYIYDIFNKNRTDKKILKNSYSHVVDAFQYMILGSKIIKKYENDYKSRNAKELFKKNLAVDGYNLAGATKKSFMDISSSVIDKFK